VGACPLYLKTHSYGEYVFDNSWANYSEGSLGQPYYPKLQACVPFTPVTGRPRLSHSTLNTMSRQTRLQGEPPPTSHLVNITSSSSSRPGLHTTSLQQRLLLEALTQGHCRPLVSSLSHSWH
jgi:predicted N-acyltransferase